MPPQTDSSSADYEVLQSLEEFFCSPTFTSALGEFMSEHAEQLEFKGFEEEQPLKNHDIFQKYSQLVDQQLDKYLSDRGIAAQAVFDACTRAQQAGNSGWLTCIDYLCASTEYEAFMELAYDHVQLKSFQPDEGADDDYELPAGEDEDLDEAAVAALGADDVEAADNASYDGRRAGPTVG